MKKMENENLDGKINIEYLDKKTVQIELDDEGCKYLIEILTDLIKIPYMHHIDLEANTMHDMGVFTKKSLSLIINHRGKY